MVWGLRGRDAWRWYSFAWPCLRERLRAKPRGAFGYIDREGNPAIPCQFSYAYAFYSGRVRVFSGTLKIRKSGCFRREASGTLWIWQGMKLSPARKCTSAAPIAF